MATGSVWRSLATGVPKLNAWAMSGTLKISGPQSSGEIKMYYFAKISNCSIGVKMVKHLSVVFILFRETPADTKSLQSKIAMATWNLLGRPNITQDLPCMSNQYKANSNWKNLSPTLKLNKKFSLQHPMFRRAGQMDIPSGNLTLKHTGRAGNMNVFLLSYTE